MVEYRFKEPLFKAAPTRDRDVVEKEPSTTRTSRSSKLSTYSEQFKRPSDYRLASIHMQRRSSSIVRQEHRIRISETSDDGVMRGASGDMQTFGFDSNDTPTKNALVADIRNLIDVLVWSMEHLEDDVSLPVTSYPDIFFISDDIILKSHKMIESLEECIMAWERYIQKMIDSYAAKV